MTEDEIEQDHLTRYNMIFRDCRMRLITIDEELTLRDALNKLAEAQQVKSACYRAETSCCDGPQAYADRQEATNEARRQVEAARGNAMAAMYRETGFWPAQFYDMGLR